MFYGGWEIILLLVVVVLLFGSGRISSLMGDVAKGIKSFKKGLSDDDDPGSKSNAKLESAASESDKAAGDKSNS